MLMSQSFLLDLDGFNKLNLFLYKFEVRLEHIKQHKSGLCIWNIASHTKKAATPKYLKPKNNFKHGKREEEQYIFLVIRTLSSDADILCGHFSLIHF